MKPQQINLARKHSHPRARIHDRMLSAAPHLTIQSTESYLSQIYNASAHVAISPSQTMAATSRCSLHHPTTVRRRCTATLAKTAYSSECGRRFALLQSCCRSTCSRSPLLLALSCQIQIQSRKGTCVIIMSHRNVGTSA